MQAGIDAVWPLTAELFRAHAVESRLAAGGVAVDPSPLRDEFVAVIEQVREAATLRQPGGGVDTSGLEPVEAGGGRDGVHGPELVAILDEMQGLARAMPGSTW